MSKCISRHGEYSEHVLDDNFVCTRCFALDEDAMVAELIRLRSDLKHARSASGSYKHQRNEAKAKLATVRELADDIESRYSAAIWDGTGYEEIGRAAQIRAIALNLRRILDGGGDNG